MKGRSWIHCGKDVLSVIEGVERSHLGIILVQGSLSLVCLIQALPCLVKLALHSTLRCEAGCGHRSSVLLENPKGKEKQEEYQSSGALLAVLVRGNSEGAPLPMPPCICKTSRQMRAAGALQGQALAAQ